MNTLLYHWKKESRQLRVTYKVDKKLFLLTQNLESFKWRLKHKKVINKIENGFKFASIYIIYQKSLIKASWKM